MGRRGNGEGGIIRHKKSGLYMARYTIQTATGPKRKTVYGKTRKEAAEKLTKAMADRDGGLIFDAENQTIGEYLQRWLNDTVRGSVKPVTFENRERVVRVHISPALGSIKLKVLAPAHVQSFYRAKLDEGLASSIPPFGWIFWWQRRCLKSPVCPRLCLVIVPDYSFPNGLLSNFCQKY